MILIGDSSALISLSYINCLYLLDSMFTEVKVPSSVFKEVVIDNAPESGKLKKYLQDKVIDVYSTNSLIIDFSLGIGEIDSMMLYKKLNADLLLIDDKRARKIANLNNIKTIGSLGILLLAKEKNIIKEVKPLIEDLRKENLHFSDSLLKTILDLANE